MTVVLSPPLPMSQAQSRNALSLGLGPVLARPAAAAAPDSE